MLSNTLIDCDNSELGSPSSANSDSTLTDPIWSSLNMKRQVLLEPGFRVTPIGEIVNHMQIRAQTPKNQEIQSVLSALM